MAVETIAPFAVLIFFLTSCQAKPENCSEAQCKALSVREGFESEFRVKASEKGVRIIYLNLKFRNDSYRPLKSENYFFPYRWVWASSLNEPMLSLSYDYDILSMGLLQYQERSMDVLLEDQPSGCLANLNSSCQNKVVGRAILNKTQSKSSEPPERDVVCVATIAEDHLSSFLWGFFDGNVRFQCCEPNKESASIQCELDVQVGGWFKAFYGSLNILTLLMMFYCPAFLLFLPDSIFNLQEECKREERREASASTDGENNDPLPLFTLPIPSESQQANSQIQREEGRETEPILPVNESGQTRQQRRRYESIDQASTNIDAENNDVFPVVAIPTQSQRANFQISEDESNKHVQSLIYLDEPKPITFSYFLRTYTKERTELFSFHFKFAFLWCCVIPIFVYIRLGLDYTVKSKFMEEVDEKPNASLVAPLFSSTLLIQSTLSPLMVLAPLIMILFSRPKDFLITVNEEIRPMICFICQENTTSVGEDMILHLTKLAENIYNLASCSITFHRKVLAKCIEFFTHCCIEKMAAPCKLVKTPFIVLWVLFWELFLVIVVGVIFGGLCLVVLLFASIALIVVCSPFITLICFVARKGQQLLRIGLNRIHQIRNENREFRTHNVKVWTFLFVHFLLLCSYLLIFVLNIYASFVGGLTGRFITRMVGLVIFGLVLNASVVGPYVAFSVVAFTNIYLCYYDLQMRYQEVKKMISENWSGEIPEDLFWHICSEASNSNHKVLPVRPQTYRMLGKMAIILIFLFLVFCSIFMVTDAKTISVVPSTIAFFLSGVIPGLFFNFFKGSTNEKRFTGETRVRMIKEIIEAVDEYKEKNAEGL